MTWEVRIKYANGQERILYEGYTSRDKALRCVDALYSREGYPLHFAYVVRSGGTSLDGVWTANC